MRVEVDMVGGKNSSGIFVHKYLSQSMGYSTAAFAQSVLQGKTQPGVWYPEEKEALQVGEGPEGAGRLGSGGFGTRPQDNTSRAPWAAFVPSGHTHTDLVPGQQARRCRVGLPPRGLIFWAACYARPASTGPSAIPAVRGHWLLPLRAEQVGVGSGE